MTQIITRLAVNLLLTPGIKPLNHTHIQSEAVRGTMKMSHYLEALQDGSLIDHGKQPTHNCQKATGISLMFSGAVSVW